MGVYNFRNRRILISTYPLKRLKIRKVNVLPNRLIVAVQIAGFIVTIVFSRRHTQLFSQLRISHDQYGIIGLRQNKFIGVFEWFVAFFGGTVDECFIGELRVVTSQRLCKVTERFDFIFGKLLKNFLPIAKRTDFRNLSTPNHEIRRPIFAFNLLKAGFKKI